MAPLSIVIATGAALLALMSLGWATQRAVGNTGWIDVFWTFGTGLAAVLLSLAGPASPTPRQWLVAGLAAAWSLRLGAYVAVRVARSPEEDRRYGALRRQWGADYQRRLLPLVLLQAPVAWLLALAVALAARAPWPAFTLFDGLGAGILAASIAGEALADEQMRRFKASAPGRSAINDRGLWGWSRHPNYFFEWLGWVAYPVILMAKPDVYPWSWAAWGAPLLMYLVLDRGTGVPPLEASMLESRGEAFRAYQARTSRFFPRPPRPPSA